MKKIIILFVATTLMAVGTYAQTQKTNRTRTRTHDRSEVTSDGTDKADKTIHEQDMDRNNTNNNTNTPSSNTNVNTNTDTSRNANQHK